MDARLLDLYEAELRYFRDISHEFAASYPKIAGRLGIDGQAVADPYVERLIEATAFLSARVSLKLDAEFPRFTDHLLEVVYPNYLAPTPSMLIAACVPDPQDDSLAAGRTIARGSTLRTKNTVGQDTYCEFRTAHELTLWPLLMNKVQYFTFAPDLNLTEHPQYRDIRGGLRFRLQTTAGLQFDQLVLDRLVVHFSGAEDVAWQLHECALGKPVGVLVRPLTATGAVKGNIASLPGEAIEPVGYRDDEALLPVTSTGFSGYRLVQEYFAFPHRFQFAAINGLRKVLQGMQVNEVEVVLLFSRGDAGLEKLVSTDNLMLNCVPAINLFEKRLDRINVSESFHEFHVVPDRTRPMDFEVHSLTEVVGHGKSDNSTHNTEQVFRPFYSAFHGSRHQHPAYYTVKREPRVASHKQRTQGHRSSHLGSEAYIQLVDPQQAPFQSSLRQLAATAWCTNRDLPLLMQLGRANELEFAGSFPVQRIAVVRGPSRPFSPTMQSGQAWRAIDHLSLNHLSLSDKDQGKNAAALREMLMLHALHVDEAQQTQIRGLLAVQSKSIVRRLPLSGPISFGRGLEVTLQLEKAAFHGHSAFTFGAVLSQYLARHANVNHFIETVISMPGKGEVMRWRPLAGSRQIL
jgi:type VI secretion system protein ImpG